MENKNMIKGNLFDLKGKRRWKALGERMLFVATDWHIWLLFGLMGYGLYIVQTLIKQQELLASFG